uniref:Uncharacterized protein n=1 Tax=Nelumbo nucifera TaxID=4432 RepID=A0A822Y3N1_NELNU|nr:TPA_asm: hypothetical protein HUJ06_028505 [Nelumbo nucifera]
MKIPRIGEWPFPTPPQGMLFPFEFMIFVFVSTQSKIRNRDCENSKPSSIAEQRAEPTSGERLHLEHRWLQ